MREPQALAVRRTKHSCHVAFEPGSDVGSNSPN